MDHILSFSEQVIIDIFQDIIDEYDMWESSTDDYGRAIYPPIGGACYHIQDPLDSLSTTKILGHNTLCHLNFFIDNRSSNYENIVRDIECIKPRLKSMGYSMFLNKWDSRLAAGGRRMRIIKVIDIRVEVPS